MNNRNLLIASTSTVYGKPYLEYLKDETKDHFSSSQRVLFIPYAQPGGISYEAYTLVARKFFDTNGIHLEGIHEYKDVQKAVELCDGIFIGGGNTFVLLNKLYELDLVSLLLHKIKKGVPYLGTSAGSNILGVSIGTTNDMPIIYPPSFKAIGAVPFNINPHYIDPVADSRHMGETRETRIREFHVFNDIPVVGLREGSYLKVKRNEIWLGGSLKARVFQKNIDPVELGHDDDLTFLIEP